MNTADYLTKRLTKICNDANRAAEQAQREAAALAHLPPEVGFDRISSHGYAADMRLTLRPVPTMEQAGSLMRLLPPLPLARVRAGTLTFKPIQSVTLGERERGDVTEIAPWYLEHQVAPFYPGGEERTIVWWSRLGESVTQVCLPVVNWEISTITIRCSGFGPNRRWKETGVGTRGGTLTKYDRYWVSEKREEAHIVFWWPLGPRNIAELPWE